MIIIIRALSHVRYKKIKRGQRSPYKKERPKKPIQKKEKGLQKNKEPKQECSCNRFAFRHSASSALTPPNPDFVPERSLLFHTPIPFSSGFPPPALAGVGVFFIGRSGWPGQWVNDFRRSVKLVAGELR
jgi:hypothetical protein